MAKKNKKYQKKYSARPNTERNSPRSVTRNISNRVLAQLYLSNEGLSANDIVKAIGLSKSGKDLVQEALSSLCRDNRIIKSGKSLFSLNKNHQLVEATIEIHPRGFGFATHLSLQTPSRLLKKDPFVSATRMGTAYHGDRVLLAITKVRRDGRPEAEVIHILERTTKQLAGFFQADTKYGLVHPEDPRFPFDILLTSAPGLAVSDGDAVIVRLLDSTEDKEETAAPNGEIVEVLGDPESGDVQIRLVIEKFTLPHRFSPKAEKEAREAVASPGLDEREDLRDIMHVTIDGDSARDFDDAVAVQKTRQGYRLHVSIADVSAFVQIGSALDREAYERGTSIYFPGTVIPMLPENLSNNLCSLLPEKDRLTVTAVLDFDRQGNLKKKRFLRSIICSRQRFTYNTVEQIVVGGDPTIRGKYKPFLTLLKWASELAEILQTKRQQRGSIGFTIPEADIRLDDKGQVQSITRSKRQFAHQIIEEFMLAANEAVAAAFTERAIPMLYRIHEKPDADKVTEFVAFSTTLGLALSKDKGTPTWYNHIISTVQNSPHEYIVNNLLLRTMQQARYNPENVGHFGLAAEDYCHFTSPIRRYPDLIVHRLLCRLISADTKRVPHISKSSPSPTLTEDGVHLSERERTAVKSERDMAERLKRQFMAKRIGESFRAVISGVSETVFFVELLDTFVSGAVALSTLRDDYYILDEQHHRLIGDISCRILQIGDVVEVVLLDVDQYRNRIEFTLGENDALKHQRDREQ